MLRPNCNDIHYWLTMKILKCVITIPKISFRSEYLVLWIFRRLDLNDFGSWPNDQLRGYSLLVNNETLCCARTVLERVVPIPKVYFRLENLILEVYRRLDFNDFVSWPTNQLQWYSLVINNESLCWCRTVFKCVVTVPKVYFHLQSLVLRLSRRLDFNDFVSWPTEQF